MRWRRTWSSSPSPGCASTRPRDEARQPPGCPASHLLHQHPCRGELAGHPCQPRELPARDQAGGLARRPHGRGPQALRHRRRRACLTRGAGRAQGLPRPRRPLRLHPQCLSLRPLPRHPGEGGGLPARLDHARAPALHQPRRRHPGRASAGRHGRKRQHRPRHLQAARDPRCRGPHRRRDAPALRPSRRAGAPDRQADHAGGRARALLLPGDDRGDDRLLAGAPPLGRSRPRPRRGGRPAAISASATMSAMLPWSTRIRSAASRRWPEPASA